MASTLLEQIKQEIAATKDRLMPEVHDPETRRKLETGEYSFMKGLFPGLDFVVDPSQQEPGKKLPKVVKTLFSFKRVVTDTIGGIGTVITGLGGLITGKNARSGDDELVTADNFNEIVERQMERVSLKPSVNDVIKALQGSLSLKSDALDANEVTTNPAQLNLPAGEQAKRTR